MKAVLWAILATMACMPAFGCRSLRHNRHTRDLSAARQLSLRGAALLQQEQYGEAAPVFREALQHSNADERAQWGMAEILWKENKRQDAIQHMTQAVKLSGQNPDLLVRLGEMHLELGSLSEAITQAEFALKMNRQHEGAWALKAEVLREEGRSQDAMDCYQRALIYNPTNVAARIAVADIYRDLGKPQRALATIDRLADSHLTESIPARAWLLKGEALADLGQCDDASHCLREAALCANGDADLLLELAQIQYANGELGEARLCLGKALQHNPHNPQALSLQNEFAQSLDLSQEQDRSVPAYTVGQSSGAN